jgi:riboflavin biosynthesis pyrimidine reductase
VDIGQVEERKSICVVVTITVMMALAKCPALTCRYFIARAFSERTRVPVVL